MRGGIEMAAVSYADKLWLLNLSHRYNDIVGRRTEEFGEPRVKL
jgi:hypothetical protein